MKNLFAVTIVLFLSLSFYAQSPGFAINHDGSNPHPYALLELDWQTAPQGFLAPRLTEANLPASPIAGLIVYQTDGDFPGYYQFINTEWIPLKHNAFNGYVSGPVLATTAPITGNSGGVVETDGAQLIFEQVNTGQTFVDLSAYSFTGTPVVTATAEYNDIPVPEICNGTWGGGIASDNHLHYLFLAAQSSLGTPIIHFETDIPVSFGLNQPDFGNDRAVGFEPLTLDDDPPGRFVYYDQNAPPASNADMWDIAGDGQDRFPHPNSASWTGSGTGEVYTLNPLFAGSAYQIQIQPFFEPIIETGQPFNTQIQIAIDFNKDGDFSDASEPVYSFTQATWLTPEVVNFIVPASAINGETKMRVVVQRADAGGSTAQTGINPDLGDSCLENFDDVYNGHTMDFDVFIDGGAPNYNYDANFCNVSEADNNGFIVRCYNSSGVSENVRFHFNVYDKF